MATVKEIGELPVMQLFNHHLKSFEGGARKDRAGIDHARRVGRLLYEIDSQPKCVRKLWQNLPMNKIRNNFFAGNDLLGDDKRRPATLKSYVVSYRLFLKFIVARREDIRELMTISETDLRQVQSALLRLDSWPKAYTDPFNRRKAEVRERDERERLSAEDFRQFTNSAKAKQLKAEYQKIAEDPERAVDPNTFAELRDYLLVRVITASGQRCGAAGNLTLEEFDKGVEHTDDLYITKTLRHKTAAGGPAKLMWDAEVKGMADTYKNNMRPLFANEKSVFPSSAGIAETPAFFITAAGQPMNERPDKQANRGVRKKAKPRYEWKSMRVAYSKGHYYSPKGGGVCQCIGCKFGKANEPFGLHGSKVLQYQ